MCIKITRSGIVYLLLLWLALIRLGVGEEAISSPLTIAVLYPDIREPYRSIFRTIMNGIEERLGESVKKYALEESDNSQKISIWLKKEQIKAAIFLGSRGLLMAKELDAEFEVVVGSVLTAPDENNLTGISLTPDPEALFQALKEIAPRIKRVTVIYNQEYSRWLIDRARISAKVYDFELNEFPIQDVREAAILYRDILSRMEGGVDSIWIPQDPSFDEKTILPPTLKEAWDRNLLIFSSNLAYIKNGVLFALYPDNKNMGRSLAELTLNKAHNDKNLGMIPLRDLLMAVNTHTADHLGLKLTNSMKRKIHLIFPPK